MSAARQLRQPAGAISTILGGLRRAPRQIRRSSRDVTETAGSQLFDAAVQPHGVEASGEYRIEELARMTRNIRVYRDRGLLHPPLRVGRMVGLGVIRLEDGEAVVVRPKLIEAFNDIRQYGVATGRVLDVHRQGATASN